ncbi:hypothetical protein [Emcibacter sp. SYSU 3D8]|uniref:hypothetical protein n=1 Tax=Emcibacter sp. SYSU 3D8 TaxID=3133969 RepID=UPI0031FE9ABF
MRPDRHRFIRNIFSGMNDIEEWRLGDAALAAAKGYPRHYSADLIDDYGIIFADLVLDSATGMLACHEVNGPNAVGSDALTGDSSLRADNEARQTIRRARELGYLRADGTLTRPVATVHAHQHWKFFRTGGEFYPRVDLFAETLDRMLPGIAVSTHAATDALDDAPVAVVMGDVPSIAAHVDINPATRQLEYRGRPLIFMGNPNLLSELTRIGTLQRDDRRMAEADLRVLHAWRLAGTFHDKCLQQRLLTGTGIRPLRHFSAQSRDEALAKTRVMLEHGPVVLKPSDTSGGTGVHVAVPEMGEDAIVGRIDALLADCLAKYGENTEATIFPIGGFEFVRSTGYPMADGDHLWDLRFAVLFEPGRAQAFPVSLRFSPQPFDPGTFHLNRDQWISNVSGRRDTLLKSGMDDDVLHAVGMTAERVEEAMQACLRWTIKAWDWSARDGAGVYEDACEERSDSFYPVEKFLA